MRAARALGVGLAVAAAVAAVLLSARSRPDGRAGESATRPTSEDPQPTALVGRAAESERSPEAEHDAAATPPAATGIEGTVTLWDGAPGKHVEVWLVPADEAVPPRDRDGSWLMEENPRQRPNVHSGTDGRYRLPLPPDRLASDTDWVVVARLALSAEVRSRPFRLPRAGESLRCDVAVPEPGVLRVRVDAGRDEPPRLEHLHLRYPRFWVSLSPGDTEVPGEWTLVEDTPPGRYAVRVLPGRYEVRASVEAGPGTEGVVEVVAGRTVEWVAAVRTDGVVRGRIVDTSGGIPFRAHVTWHGQRLLSALTDAEGRFAFRGLGRGPGRLEAEGLSLGRLRARLDGVVPDGPDVTLVLRRFPALVARIEGVPPGTSIRTLELARGMTGGSHGTVDKGGRIRREGYFEEPSVLVFKPPGPALAPLLVRVPVLEPESERDAGTLRFGPGVDLRGRVVDATGRGVEGAEVAIADRWATEIGVTPVTTSADGSFHLEHLPPEPLFLRVRGAGYPQHVQRVDPSRAEPCEVIVTKGGRADVEVVDPDGGSLDDVWLLVHLAEDLPYDADGASTMRSVSVRPDGRAALLLCAGPRRLSAHAGDRRSSERVAVTIREGETTPVRLVLRPPEEE